MLFDRQELYYQLKQRGLAAWSGKLQAVCEQRLTACSHGTMPHWIATWNELPPATDTQWNACRDAIAVSAQQGFASQTLSELLMQFHPWRKGPFELFGITIDTEWRSNWKWDRLAQHINFHGKSILDVGCGNGYYGWRMLAEGADWVVGCEPYPLYWMQFEVLRRYAPRPERHFVIPLADHELPSGLRAFDITLSMGVLYHRTSPIDHLQTLGHSLKSGGQLILETLIVEPPPEVLVPEDRYAKMRNVWFLPSLSLLSRWLERTGFKEIQVLDVTATTIQEQRRTDWMTFESLGDFLHPHNASLTMEGYPAPLRAILSARKK